MFPSWALLASLLALACLTTFVDGAALLSDDEVEALKQIAKTLGIKGWNLSVDPCTGEAGVVTVNREKALESAVTCNCTFQNKTVCHVISIVFKCRNLRGALPPELVLLPFVQEIDFSRNFLNGTIPPEWGTLPLVNISLVGNRLSGSLPKQIGNISTLRNLILESNRLSGPLPPELGNLVNIERILLSSNKFTGELPETLAKLTNLKDFRVSDNNITGKIPGFIQNWIKLQKIAIQGSGLQGPIPSGISLLTKVTDMRISDINGPASAFPSLSEMKNMKTLILRNCNLTGKISDFIGEMMELKTLDLSFNKLTGQIPSNFENLVKSDFMFLTSNFLSGPVPEWLQSKGDNIDLSYNNFTSTGHCQIKNVNLFGSTSTGNNSVGIVPCLKNFSCAKNRFSLHINCGGKEVSSNGSIYEADDRNGTPSIYFSSGDNNWAISNTGNFLDDDEDLDKYIAIANVSFPMNNSDLYKTARLSPLSLTYYGLCLLNGNYTVKLHFAEIIFRNDSTFYSLGRRVFDVYIQGKLVLKDFNIEDEAGGAGKAIVKNFPAVVIRNTLEIRFIWAGKGTTAIPVRGTYGPLISAISVNPNFVPPSEDGKKISALAVTGIVVGALCVVSVVLGILWWKGCLCGQPLRDPELRGLDLQTGSFTLRQIKAATNNFDDANKIGEGGFGPVFKGLLSDGTIIAVKQLSSKSKQGNREFVNEIGMISALQHPNLVKLYGCCIEGNQLLLVYEYMENNSLARALWGPEEKRLKLDWPTRYRICTGIAKGLTYLHEESRLKIVHRDIKTTNVLLDKYLKPKISDFGLAKLDDEDNSHISTRVAGTFGYMAPEYAMRGYLTDKADVYSFGIVALEIVSGKSNANYRPKEDCVYLLDWVYVLKERGDLMELIDPKLGSDFDKEEVMGMINMALQCSNSSPSLRPTMSAVVSMLEGRTAVQKVISDPSFSSDDLRFRAMVDHLQQNHKQSQTHSVSTDGPWTGSSVSGPDLYPVKLDSQYWSNRV
ncbi:probable leucine-rich repeat receptor-like serine/threonine-protein kinase At3g14840 [Aristolochia californica]|uniref:probable leucine-rich repeat receptor-like serine/threonine-protein kinase At3g14840 n=1 Tax=Aristolochia californica TaxID=171875 RepID=UPI0035DD80EF